MKERKDLSSKFWITVLIVCTLFVIVIAFGFAIYDGMKRPVIENDENGGEVTLNYVDDITGLKIKDMVPTADTVGIKNNKELLMSSLKKLGD